jgi:hypothetical protein
MSGRANWSRDRVGRGSGGRRRGGGYDDCRGRGMGDRRSRLMRMSWRELQWTRCRDRPNRHDANRALDNRRRSAGSGGADRRCGGRLSDSKGSSECEDQKTEPEQRLAECGDMPTRRRSNGSGAGKTTACSCAYSHAHSP